MPYEPTAGHAEAVASVLKLLADPARLRLIYALLHGEHSVGDLAAHIGAPPSAVSQHLAKLRLAGIVRTRREGTRVFYSAADNHLEVLVTEAFLHAHPATTTAPARRRRASA